MFYNEIGQQRLQFENKIINRVKYLNNLNDIYFKKDKTFAKILRNLKRSRGEITKTLKVYQRDVKRINLLEQNNKVIAQYNQKKEENAKLIKQNLKEIYKLNEFPVEIDEKSEQVFLHAAQILVDLRQQQSTDLHQGLCSGVIKKFCSFHS